MPAAISVGGRTHPYRAGSVMTGGEPFLAVWKRQGAPRYFWTGTDFENLRVATRPVGAKFRNEAKEDQSYSNSDVVGVNITSWDYPAVRAGYHDPQHIFDFRGLSIARTALDEYR